jgi:anti-anti-sigma regulatory factor
MALTLTSVVFPYQILGADTTSIPTVQVNAIAASVEEAQVEAKQVAHAWVMMRHPGKQFQFSAPRTKLMSDRPVEGPFAYVLSHRSQIQALQFPSRVDDRASERLKTTLLSLQEDVIYGVVMDMKQLGYINSIGLTGIATNVQRLHLQLYHVPDNIRKVLDMVGLDRFLPNLSTALARLVQDAVSTG